uniref:Uncharacterized protein n=1 Tax=Fundidesulfovibrio putealis TaxID=270496 RepID=A0A7C4EK42_9BACT
MKYMLALLVVICASKQAWALDMVPLEACTLMDDVMEVKGRAWRVDSGYGGCGTPYQDLPSVGPIKTNVAFYANGNGETVRQLKIVLNVNDTSTEKHSIETFKHYCGKLFAKLVKNTWSSEVSMGFDKAIISGERVAWNSDGFSFSIHKRIWQTGKGHEYQFLVE